MVNKVKVILKIQSFSDIITNSSSEIFCAIRGEENSINLIYEYLKSLGVCERMYSPHYNENNDYEIQFWIEYGGEEDCIGMMIPLLKEVLKNNFDENTYKIIEGYDWDY